MYEDILYSVTGPVAEIRFNRPDRLNAMTPRMRVEFKHAVAQAEADVIEATAFHHEGVSELKTARQPVYDAKGNVMQAEENLALQTRMTEVAKRRATSSGNDRIEMDNLGTKARR